MKCEHDDRFKGVFFLPKSAKGCLACHVEQLSQRLQEIKQHWQEGIGDVHENAWRQKMAELVGETEGLEDR